MHSSDMYQKFKGQYLHKYNKILLQEQNSKNWK